MSGRTAKTQTVPVTASQTALFINGSIVQTASGGVDSVFGRTGVVVATSGDYAVGQVTGAAPLASPAFTGSASFTASGTQSTTAATITVNSSGTPIALAITSGSFANTAALIHLTQANGSDSGAAISISNAGSGNDITGTNWFAKGGTISLNGATPTGSGSAVGLGKTVGVGNSTPGAILAPALGTGTGPASPSAVVNWLEIDIGGTKFWLPLCQ